MIKNCVTLNEGQGQYNEHAMHSHACRAEAVAVAISAMMIVTRLESVASVGAGEAGLRQTLHTQTLH